MRVVSEITLAGENETPPLSERLNRIRLFGGPLFLWYSHAAYTVSPCVAAIRTIACRSAGPASRPSATGAPNAAPLLIERAKSTPVPVRSQAACRCEAEPAATEGRC